MGVVHDLAWHLNLGRVSHDVKTGRPDNDLAIRKSFFSQPDQVLGHLGDTDVLVDFISGIFETA